MKKVYIDLGHGGNDSGAINKSKNVLEKNICLEVGNLLNSKLKNCGLEVKLSRTNDITKSLSQRTSEANKWGADCLVSIHVNDASNIKAKGLETYCFKFKYKKLADCIHSECIKSGLYTNDRGVKEGNLHMIRESRMSAALIELFFINNEDDINKLLNKKENFAIAIAKGICRYLEIPYIDQNTKPKIYKIVTGGFGSKENAEIKAKQLKDLTRWYVEVKEVSEYTGDYCIHTGGFTGLEKVQRKMNALKEITNWWMDYVEE